MTITADRPDTTTRDPRELLNPWPGLFDTLAAYVAKHQEVTLPYAEGVIEQTLIWLKACADNPTQRVGMSETVDPGWHAFLLHSEPYAEFCQRMFGGFLHHVPPAPGRTMTDDEMAATLPALHATGYPVNEAHWTGVAYGCCPPDPCTRATPTQPRQPTDPAPDKPNGLADCKGGTGAPPPGASAPAQA